MFLGINFGVFREVVVVWVVFHVGSSGVFLMGNVRLAVVICISYSFSKR